MQRLLAATAASASPSAFLSHQWLSLAWARILAAPASSYDLQPPIPSTLPSVRYAASQASSPTSTDTAPSTSQPSTAQQQLVPAASPLQPHVPQWDWRWVLGRQQGRKPAIKRPARHQWHYCNPNYDPQHPLPPKMLTPYTPATNLQQDEWQVFRTQKQHHRQPNAERYRQQFVRWLALRDLDWRNAFFEGIAADAKRRGLKSKRKAEARRQRAWAEFVQQNIATDGTSIGR
ncbi:hypothetical protein DUNSADRAFT_3330 [Dunaliella salina]|uniref:Uncharacterized protein n=1 Tax=Dunaliella salina TaxID=3046 RepID=A0ABQ7GU50_DUNSA|nr:hypothetical protein DUNSADRAFT_3330 [Dunaliella salina]|eukprot:KAF5838135.1 hypothetical protein DUNSADRAFT_3330 [Dunaliella salina]